MRNYFFPLVFLLSSSAFAQDTLSLARAISLGLKNNFDVQIVEQNVEIARNNNTWGQAGRLPIINFNAGQNNLIIQRKPANPFAVAGRNISNNVTGQLDVQFTLFDGFAIKFNKHLLGELEKLSLGNAVVVMENTIQSIVLSYYQSVLEKERLNVLIRNQIFSKERYEYVKLKRELGNAITFDVLQEQNNYLTDSSNVLRQEILLRNSLRNLNRLINEDLNTTYSLSDSLTYDLEPYDYNELHERMIRSNSNLINQYTNQEILRTNTKLFQSNQYPSLVLSTGANGSYDQLNANFRTSTGNTIEQTVGYVNRDTSFPVYNDVNEIITQPLTQVGNSYGAYGNFALRFTLFNGGQVRRSIENARVQEKIAQLGTDRLKLSLENDLMATFDLYNLRRQLVTISEVKLQAAELNLDLANERYRNGALSAIDLRIVQENYRNAALEYTLAIYSSIESKIELIRMSGGLISQADIEN
ncbi:MAG: TolC family protein [Flammeovirgaceae bacterium]|nr:TolC family protein [Flammeovirgaceae bacterium]